MNVGDYVRTKDGIIDKVIIKYEGHCNNPECSCKHVSCKYNYYDEEDIIKSSSNIIDLIEVGDYVNGYEVEDITHNGEEYVLNILPLSNYFQSPLVYNEDIKSIVTKEQFESMKYVVESEVK